MSGSHGLPQHRDEGKKPQPLPELNPGRPASETDIFTSVNKKNCSREMALLILYIRTFLYRFFS